MEQLRQHIEKIMTHVNKQSFIIKDKIIMQEKIFVYHIYMQNIQIYSRLYTQAMYTNTYILIHTSIHLVIEIAKCAMYKEMSTEEIYPISQHHIFITTMFFERKSFSLFIECWVCHVTPESNHIPSKQSNPLSKVLNICHFMFSLPIPESQEENKTLRIMSETRLVVY